MIAEVILAAQSIVTAAPPIEDARPATTWSCQFVGSDAASFQLNGFFAEAPVGSDPNVAMPTKVDGTGPASFLGAQRYNAFDSFDQLRTYMVHRNDRDGSSYTVLFNLMKDDNLGLATITRYVPDTQSGRGKLSAFAAGTCSAKFHPLGYAGAGK
jgi:hypothetical protein